MAKRPGNVDLGYIDHVRQRARALGVDDLSDDPIEDLLRTSKTISVVFNMPHNGHGPASSTTGAP